MRKVIISLAILISMCSCVTNYTPPQKHDFKNTIDIDKPFNEVWNKAVEWFAFRGTPLKNMDKNSGFISTEFNLASSTMQYMDCGNGGSQTAGSATINLIIRSNSENSTKITVNAFYSCFLSYMGWTKGSDERVNCESNGVYEKEFFEYISK